MDLEIYGVSAVLVIIGLVQLVKSVMPDNLHKYGGILAVALGLGASYGYTFFSETEMFQAIIIGLALGLSAAGLYSTQKNARE